MRSSTIIDLIIAHSNGEEIKFKEIVHDLYETEKKKGNLAIAERILEAYEEPDKKESFCFSSLDKSKTEYNLNSSSQLMERSLRSYRDIPKDKDSMLDLYEIFYSDTKLEDVILPKMQKEFIMQIVKEYRISGQLLHNNLTPTNRVLLCGPPGCGKTMTAKAIANELQLPIAYVRLDSLISSYLGQTGTNLRKIFDSVINRNIVLFLDEFDAIAKKRDDGQELGELKRVVTTLLQNFDMLDTNVFLIAATNHEHLLDPAIWRRFNVTINIGLPDEQQRVKLIERFLNKYAYEKNLDISNIAKIMNGVSAAQIEEVLQQSAKRAFLRSDYNVIRYEDILTNYIQSITKYTLSDNEQLDWNVLKYIYEKGVTLKDLERATSIPTSTLSYNFKKMKEEVK